MRTRDRIISEATRQLCELGYADFTMAGVREALRLSSGSMFHAFGSKADLGAHVYVSGMVDYQGHALVAIAECEGEAGIEALVRAHLSWVQDHRALARFLYATPSDELAVLVNERLTDHNARFYSALEDFYRSVVVDGLMALVEVGVAHSLCVGPAQEYCRQWTRDHSLPEPLTYAETFGRAALAALGSTRQTTD